MEWYSFMPTDTLLFKGAEPMNLGENHTSSVVFPPVPSTIAGAFRSAVLRQNNISVADYYDDNIDNEFIEIIGKAGEEANFVVAGPLFQFCDTVFIPAPYSWFIEKTGNLKSEIKIYKSKNVRSNFIKTSNHSLLWAKSDGVDLISLGGFWISLDDLFSKNNFKKIKKVDDFFISELRTGIALENNRSVREGHLYSFPHARLKQNVRLLFGLDKILPIGKNDILKLGAEQRFGVYQKISDIKIESGQSGLFLSLSPVEGSDTANEAIIATGKIQYVGGWDMKKGFHKPIKGYFPAGSVFSKKLNNSFIEI